MTFKYSNISYSRSNYSVTIIYLSLPFYYFLVTELNFLSLMFGFQEIPNIDSTHEKEALELSSSELSSKVSLNDVPRNQQRDRNPSSAFNLLRSRTYDRNYYYRESPKTANIPKLLLPKSHRPRMYSLDGFIPKPNIQKFSPQSRSPVETVSTEPMIREQQVRRNSWKPMPADDEEYSSRKRVRDWLDLLKQYILS